MAAGQFQPGQSGNPAGRPKGARSKALVALERIGEEEAEAIMKALVERAKGGDPAAARPILDRIWPPRKGAPIEFDLPEVTSAESLVLAIGSIVQQVAVGKLTPDEGTVVTYMMEAQRKALETADVVARLDALESRLAAK